MVEKEVVNVPELESTRELAFEQCIKIGDRIVVAGQTGTLDGEVVSREFEPQVKRTFERIELALNAAGASLSDLTRTTTYITDMRYKRDFTDIRGEILGDDLATSALIGVESLALPEMLVEVESEAMITE